MKTLLRIEEAFILALAVYLNTLLPFPWWYFWAWFLAPDLGLIGYALSTRAGAITYNICHHKGIAILLYFAGTWFALEEVQLAGLVLLGHSSFDRILGYGLKFPDHFHNTHLGRIGPKRDS